MLLHPLATTINATTFNRVCAKQRGWAYGLQCPWTGIELLPLVELLAGSWGPACAMLNIYLNMSWDRCFSRTVLFVVVVVVKLWLSYSRNVPKDISFV